MRNSFVLSLIDIALLFALAIALSGCVESQPISISLEGTTFEQGEEINFSIKNNSSQSVFFNGCNAYAVEQFSGGQWFIVDELLIRCFWEGIAGELKAGEIWEADINSAILNPGTYRISAYAALGCTPGEPLSQASCSSELTAKSAEFSITVPTNTATVYYRGEQCEPWPWTVVCEQGCQLPDDIKLIENYYEDNYGIEILSVSVAWYVACEACDVCPSSEEFTAVIYEMDKQQMLSLGWKEEPSS